MTPREGQSNGPTPQDGRVSKGGPPAGARASDFAPHDHLIDGFGRVHRDLRVSLTDRCSLRCSYCMPAEGVPWLPSHTMLTATEIVRLVRIAVRLGVTEVRLTGGEPLLRPDVVSIVRDIASLQPRPEISLTTNGLRLPGLAASLAQAGLNRVNISLDTLDPETFQTLTRRDRLADTLAGIASAGAAGLHPIKINSVLLRGVNDHEAPTLLMWALEQQVEWRFIEQMPLDPQHQWNAGEFVSAAETLQSLRHAGFSLESIPTESSAPAQRWRVTGVPGGGPVSGGLGSLGVVASVTEPFCGRCDRLRLTADGQFRSCLFAHREADLRTPMRQGATDHDLAEIMRSEIRKKAQGHGIDSASFKQPGRPMSAIGG
ncbi:MAG: GTP 3',8-cyclase MoaA [Actinobacteria bacterium]|nr:GTP 3',8-cyclase MoaA [Actinomycetota bacterium]